MEAMSYYVMPMRADEGMSADMYNDIRETEVAR